MGTTRIMSDKTINVEAVERDGEKHYTISGDGAEDLQVLCRQQQVPVSDLYEGTFTISQRTINNELRDSETLTRVYICNAIVQASKAARIDPLATFTDRFKQRPAGIESRDR